MTDGARFVELPGAGHGVPIHALGEVNALLAGHFAAAERTAAS
jgi:pimeloyl-ACP methyl ester carboxylesterase